MTEPQNISPRSRMQALLAIPDNQRTEEQWDELHELEITLAPGNRIGQQDRLNMPPAGQGKGGGGRGPMGNPRGGPKGAPRGENRNGGGGGRGGQGPRPPNAAPRKPVDAPQVAQAAEGAPAGEAGGEAPAGGSPVKRPFRRFHKKPPKPAEA